MSSNTQLLLLALGAVIALIVLIARFKLHPFVVLIVVSLAMGTAAGMPLGTVVKAFQDGVGGVLAFIAIVVALGTMLGKLMAESGAAARIATTLIARFGESRVHWAIMFVAFIVGIPVFFQVGFVLLVPLVFTIARRTGMSLVKIGIPLVAGLSVVHGMVPPHPAAMLAVGAYHADVGRTIAYALLVGLPTAALAGPIFASWIAPRITLPPENPIAEQFAGGRGGGGVAREMPGFGISLFTVLLPVILMLCASAADVALDAANPVRAGLDFVGGPIVALLVALLFSFWSLGYRQHFTRDQILKFANDCLGPTATILLVIGAGGGFNRVLIESGVGKAIADVALGSHASPLLLAWTVAALIRVATGSATVAMTTAAGIVAPIAAATPGTSPDLLVLATGAGSLVLSHVNDSGFWLIKEFFNMTVPQTLKTWTVAETIIGVAGLGFTLLLSLVVSGCAPREQGGWIDVTATLDPAKTPVYEGDAPMKFDFLKDMRKGDILTLSVYSMGAHSGTHIDAPMHFVAGGAPIDQVALDPLIGPARVIDIPDSVQAIDAAELNTHAWKGAKRVLFRTRSTLRGWMDDPAFHKDFAYIAPDAAQLLADAGVVLVGVDYISAEQFGAPAPRTHQILLGRGIPIVEGLDLRPVQTGDYDLVVLPLKVRGHEGAPARAIMRKRGS